MKLRGKLCLRWGSLFSYEIILFDSFPEASNFPIWKWTTWGSAQYCSKPVLMVKAIQHNHLWSIPHERVTGFLCATQYTWLKWGLGDFENVYISNGQGKKKKKSKVTARPHERCKLLVEGLSKRGKGRLNVGLCLWTCSACIITGKKGKLGQSTTHIKTMVCFVIDWIASHLPLSIITYHSAWLMSGTQ